jgi:hypothetical protein
MNAINGTVTRLTEARRFMSVRQHRTIANLMLGEEGDWFRDKLMQVAATIAAMPSTHGTDGQGDSAIAHLRYFAGGSASFYITEKDAERGPQFQAFGLAHLGPGYDPELGYISLPELFECGAELDLHFTPAPLSEIRRKLTKQEAA